ncbi:sister chromatid cohesion protein DCC1-like [Paramacrobiotus metropolitanus]|uniref:sister chromatid cohesion protein DCC1-like n=1 Tax=Paramacrobiotus metropolitanus TaxID=2943436 RepID=UPI0024464168|nr:sister chromatid cohesion protein DCC1-like [Paramacrobiotus metropolitanus]XP_055329512.1 sister chromatid cohesion protein DCC1-like [Paramacrobiotus metropolitanus]
MCDDAAHEHYRSTCDIGPATRAARISLPNLFPEVQVLKFSDDLSCTETVLLEASEELITKIESGIRFVIRGSRCDTAVLCSPDRTWEIKARETSNSLLVAPDVATAGNLSLGGESSVTIREIPSVTSEYLELRQIIPHWGLAKHLLEEAPFSGYANEEKVNDKRKYTFSDLLDLVQSSEEELLCYLRQKIPACEIDGYWRLLDNHYIYSIAERIASWTRTNALDENKIPSYEAYTALLDMEPEEVMRNFFWERFAERSGDVLRIRKDAIRRQLARIVLSKIQTTSLSVMNELFVREIGSEFSMADVEGIAFRILDDKLNVTDTVEYFPKEDLRIEPEARFQALFDARPRWTREEILPFICDILLPGQTADQLLFKYAKSYLDRSRSKKRSQTETEDTTVRPMTYFIALRQL